MSNNIIKSNAIKATKNLLLQEQKGNFDKEKLIEDIILGKSSLLTANDIALRLGVPIEEFHQWVKNADPKYQTPANTALEAISHSLFDALLERKESTKFIKPDVYIGRHPRWTVETFRNWLRANLK